MADYRNSLEAGFLQQEKKTILKMMKLILNLTDVTDVNFTQERITRDIRIHVSYCTDEPIAAENVFWFFNNNFRMNISLVGVEKPSHNTVVLVFKIVNAEVSTVTVKAEYERCTAQSVIAAAVIYDDEGVEHVTIPDLDEIEETTRALVFDSFQDDVAFGMIDYGCATIETEWRENNAEINEQI